MSADNFFFKRKKDRVNTLPSQDTFPQCEIIGTFTGYNVEIQDAEHMQKLYYQVCRYLYRFHTILQLLLLLIIRDAMAKEISQEAHQILNLLQCIF